LCALECGKPECNNVDYYVDHAIANPEALETMIDEKPSIITLLMFYNQVLKKFQYFRSSSEVLNTSGLDSLNIKEGKEALTKINTLMKKYLKINPSG
jgi:hypothetical protein